MKTKEIYSQLHSQFHISHLGHKIKEKSRTPIGTCSIHNGYCRSRDISVEQLRGLCTKSQFPVITQKSVFLLNFESLRFCKFPSQLRLHRKQVCAQLWPSLFTEGGRNEGWRKAHIACSSAHYTLFWENCTLRRGLRIRVVSRAISYKYRWSNIWQQCATRAN